MALLAAALLFGVADMWFKTMQVYGAPEITLGGLWALISVHSMNMVEAIITRHLWSPIWNAGISPILVAPAWSFFLVLGFLFFVFGQPKPAPR
jgi:hypothetical protein